MKKITIIAPVALWLMSSAALSATYYVKKSCKLNGNGLADACATVSGGAGAFKTIQSAANMPGQPALGSVVRIHTGTYSEQVRPAWPGVIFQPFGDGAVTISVKGGNVPVGQGLIYVANASSLGFIRNGVNDVTFRSIPGSKLIVSNYSGPAFAAWGCAGWAGPAYLTAQRFTIDGVEMVTNGTGFFADCANGFRVVNAYSHGNSYGGGEIWRSDGFYVGNSVLETNGSTRSNNDNLTIQDSTNGTIEYSTVFGAYEGIDIGTQNNYVNNGCAFCLVRFNVVHDHGNSNFPHSSILTGPVTYAYNVAYNSVNAWGSFIAYESLGVQANGNPAVYYWNNTQDNVHTGFNIVDPLDPNRTRASLFNNIVKDSTNFNGPEPSPIWIKGNNASSAVFVNEAGADYRLASGQNSSLIDSGSFFDVIVSAVTSSTQVRPLQNPKTFVRAGDIIEFQGIGKRTVVSLDDTYFYLDRPGDGSGVYPLALPILWQCARSRRL